MGVADTMRGKLQSVFTPASLVIVDESSRHAGHAGARPGGETHFRLEMVSAAFSGRSRIERQRMVHTALATELGGPVHALSLSLLTPEEAAAKGSAAE